MLSARHTFGAMFFALFLLFSGGAGAQSLTISIPDASTGVPATGATAATPLADPLMTDALIEQIRTLIRVALLTGDTAAFENAMFDLTVESPNIAASIAAFTTSEISVQISAPQSTSQAQTPVVMTQDFVQALTIAATVGPATAAPDKYQEIITATTKVMTDVAATPLPVGTAATNQPIVIDQAAMMEQISAKVETGLIGLFNDPNIQAADLQNFFTAAGPAGLTEQPTTQSASPTG